VATIKAPKTVYACQDCGAQSPKWLGRCPDCGAWNTMVEERAPAPVAAGGTETRYATPALGPGRSATAQRYADVSLAAVDRIGTGLSELDRVLGGGVVPGSLVLLGGEPGIGKSTLLLQAAAHFARHVGPVLYASGEESEPQIKARGERLASATIPSTCSGRRASSGCSTRRCG
jgi:DNA repair protein RadA/Sms